MNLRFAASAACFAILTGCSGNTDDARTAADHVVSVTTTYPGASAAEVEAEVTWPIETALNGLPGVQSVASTSRDGISRVSVDFGSGSDPAASKTAVLEAIADWPDLSLPALAGPPTIGSLAADALPGIWLALAAENRPPEELFVVAERARRRLVRIPKIEEVRILGGLQRELQVRMDPQRLAARKLSLDDCLEAIERNAKGKQPTLDDLYDIVLAMRDGAPVRLRDVAQASEATALPESQAWLEGQSVVALGVFVARRDDAGEVLESIRKELPQAKAELPADVSLELALGAAAPSRGGLLVELLAPPDSKPEKMRDLAIEAERSIRPLASGEVLSYWTREDDGAVRLLLHPKDNVMGEAAVRRALRSKGLPGVRFRDARLPCGAAACRPRYDLELALIGAERELLAKWSAALATRLSQAGYQDVVDEAPAPTAEVSVTVDREETAKYGISTLAIAQTVSAAKQGVLLSSPGESDALPIRVFLGAEADDLGSLPIPVGNGTLVPLSRLAEIKTVAGVQKIDHLNWFRRMVRVTAALPAGGDAAARDRARHLAYEVRDELRLPGGCFVELR